MRNKGYKLWREGNALLFADVGTNWTFQCDQLQGYKKKYKKFQELENSSENILPSLGNHVKRICITENNTHVYNRKKKETPVSAKRGDKLLRTYRGC